MSEAPPDRAPAPLDEARRHKAMFDNTWTLATVLATALAVLCWYFGVARVDIGPIVWTLAGLSLAQLALSSRTQRATSPASLGWLALASQLAGTVLMGVSWHSFGGMQQPLFPLFMVLPLLPAALVMGFWQQQVALLGLLAVLASGVVLSADTNSFIEARYGLRLVPSDLLPSWLPRSAIAFPDVSTSPAYDLVLMATVGIIAVAISMTARALVGLCLRRAERAAALEQELARVKHLNTQLVAAAPVAAVLVAPRTGRIISASDKFAQAFAVAGAPGRFFLDTINFEYPGVVRQLLRTGGEIVQGATVQGRAVVLRIRAALMGSGETQTVSLTIERCEEMGWRTAVDALDEPVFAVNSSGDVVFLNRSARALFGSDAEVLAVAGLFSEGVGRWWDIAPLESARRILDRGERRYLASIKRERMAASIGELSFVHLHEPPAGARSVAAA